MHVRTELEKLTELLRLPDGVADVRWLEVEPGSIPSTVDQPRLGDVTVVAHVQMASAGWERLDQELGARLEDRQTVLPLDLAEAVLPPWNPAIVRRVTTAAGETAVIEGARYEGRRVAVWPWRAVATIRVEQGLLCLLRHQSTDSQRLQPDVTGTGDRTGSSNAG